MSSVDSESGSFGGRYFHDLQEQPAALRRTLERLAEAGSPELEAIGERLQRGGFPFVVLTGMGSSFHGLHPLLLRLTAYGTTALHVETAALIHEQSALLGRGPLVIAVSQSGRSAESLRLLERAKGRATVLGITNTPDSPLALESDACVLTRAGEEATVSCKTYVSGLLALEWLGRTLTGVRDVADLRQAPELVESFSRRFQEFARQAAETLRPAASIFLVGRGVSLASVGTGGLIIKEATCRHAEGMSAAAFRHGPFEMVSPSVLVVVFDGEGELTVLNRRLAGDIRAAGGRVVQVGVEAPEEWARLPQSPASLLPILEILPVQVISLSLAELWGREAGRFRLARKVTDSE